jgi:outer membrane protein assembly factor BamE (lipoprotein component of BamABCDE complex)
MVVFVASIAACSPKLAPRGNLPSDIKLTQVTVGVHKRDDVRSILGAPSTLGTFEDSVWYYIGQNTTQFAFFREKIIEQKVVVIVFSDQGVVEQLEVLDQDALREISLSERTTPTAGHSLGFIEQILGNIGRFNK